MIAPARTGSDSRSKIVVISTDHTNKGMLSMDVVDDRMFVTVVMKFTDPKIEDAPAKCSLKMAISTLIDLWNIQSDRGG